MPRGGPRPNSGPKKGSKHKATIAKDEARELARQLITCRLQPMIEAQVAAAIGTHKLMLRKSDGTWRAATEEDDVEKALNGDPNMYWIAPNPPSTPAFNTLSAYALDKPKEQEQDIKVDGELVVKWQS